MASIKSNIIKQVEAEYLRSDLRKVQIGDTVKVMEKIKEGTRERIQTFEGTIISKKGEGINETFCIRKISAGIGVEKTFLVNSPKIVDIKLIRSGKVRRAKLYFLRDRVGKAAKIKEKLLPKKDS